MCRSTCLPPVEGKKRDPGIEIGSSPWLGVAQERRGLSLFILGLHSREETAMLVNETIDAFIDLCCIAVFAAQN